MINFSTACESVGFPEINLHRGISYKTDAITNSFHVCNSSSLLQIRQVGMRKSKLNFPLPALIKSAENGLVVINFIINFAVTLCSVKDSPSVYVTRCTFNILYKTKYISDLHVLLQKLLIILSVSY